MASLYEILGVPKTASQEQLKAAFRKAAMRWHPDRNPGNEPFAAERFKEAKLAYEFLSEPERRVRYDKELDEAEASESSSAQSKEEAFLSLLRVLTEAAVKLVEQGKDRNFIVNFLVDEGCALNVAQFVSEQATQIAGKKSDVRAHTPSSSEHSQQAGNSRPSKSGKEQSDRVRRYAGATIIGIFLIIGGVTVANVQPFSKDVLKSGAAPLGGQSLAVSPDAASAAAGDLIVSDPYEGPVAALPVLSAQADAIPSSKLPPDQWRIDQDEFGTKLLGTVSRQPNVGWLKTSTVVAASQFADVVIFKDWWAKLPPVKNFQVKYIGAREFGGNEDGPLWWALIFEIRPVGVSFDCPACRPLIGVVALTVDNEGVATTKTNFVLLGSFGRFGAYPLIRQAIAKTAVSQDETLLMLHDPKTIGGLDSAHLRYFRVNGNQLNEVLDVPYWSDNSHSTQCTSAPDLQRCGEYAPELTWVRESGSSYYALAIDEKGIKTDSNGAVVQSAPRYYYRFDGMKFVKSDSAA